MPHDTTNLGNTTNMFEGEMVNSQDVRCSKRLKTKSYQCSSNQNYMEESVLTDLQRVTTQLTEKTRVRLRDAFYRLAESSKSSVNFCNDGQHIMISNDDTLRYRETDASESKTTSIDRFVASLMLSKSNIEKVNNQHIVSCCQYQKNYSDDAEVPVWERFIN
ncbi:protein LNK3-like [Rutidosis leptorrhynchoides]|uniref:protein LNK3-like n=1 Tax=Rutidosis leptorrhynchoides TaxID=125765 RepID=UPI003A991DB9